MWNTIVDIFNTTLFIPLLNLLVYLYNTIAVQDLGIAIVIFTLITKILLFPLNWKQIKSQKNLSRMQELQPKLKKIQEKYKNDPAMQSKKIMEFYRENNLNPFGSCLPILIQMPILIALYQVMVEGLKPKALNHLYSFIHDPGALNHLAFNFLDLSKPSPVIAVITGLLIFYQSKMLMAKTQNTKKLAIKKKNNQDDPTAAAQAMTSKYMLYMMPIMMAAIYWSLPSGLPFYFAFSTIFAIIQQYFMLKRKDAGK
jgi:YidC/Oxa1 family membrane protein insertase